MRNSKPVVILVADDDADDRLMIADAFRESLKNEVRFVADGEELLDYLNRRGKFTDRDLSPRPGLVLLDLNMPRLDGREALKAIKADPQLRGIPIVILTTSKAEEDIFRTYNFGANSFIVKPVTFESLIKIAKDLGRYWFEIVELPTPVAEQGA